MPHRNVLAIIPARGGSQGLPRKNILELGGVPLIAHSITAARASSYVDQCVVSTDDEEIAAVARTWGANVLMRPAALATSSASSESVIAHVLDELERSGPLPDLLVLLQPTSPLRTTEHLDAAIELLDAQQSAGAVVSVCDFEHPPQRAFVFEDGQLEPLFDWTILAKPRQAYPRTARPNGAIYLTWVQKFRSSGSLYTQPVLGFHMSREASVDIDTEDDLIQARNFLSRHQPRRSSP